MALGAAVAGGMCGIMEAIWRNGPLFFAMLLYAAGATAMAVLAGWLVVRGRRRAAGMPFTLGFTCTATVAAFALARFALWRDLFLEAPGMQMRATLGAAVLAAGVAVIAGAASRTFERRWLRHRWLAWAFSLPGVLTLLFATYGVYAPVLAGLNPAPLAPKAVAPQGLSAPRQRVGVVLVVIDALRADALGAMHRGAPLMPHLDALAQDSLLFENASAHASWTKPAMASLFTSQHAHTHRTMSKTAVLPSTDATLPSVLQDHGIPTLAVVTNYNLAAMFGFARGFDTFTYLPADRYLQAPSEAARLSVYNAYRWARERLRRRHQDSRFFYQPAQAVNRHALAWLDQSAPDTFFMWLHYMEPHDPYVAIDGTSYARVSDPRPTPLDAPAMRDAYYDGVHRADAALGEFIAALQERGIYDETLVIVTADHGEEFGEHGGFYHGTSLYESLLHVPLIMRVPHTPPRHVTSLARHIDVAPTVTGFLQITPPLAFEGQNLLTATEATAPQSALAEEDHQGHVLRAMRWHDEDGATHKLVIANPDNPRHLPAEEWFNLTHDPQEMHPLTPDGPVAQQARHRLHQALGEKPRNRNDALHPLDTADEAALRSLGYVQ